MCVMKTDMISKIVPDRYRQVLTKKVLIVDALIGKMKYEMNHLKRNDVNDINFYKLWPYV